MVWFGFKPKPIGSGSAINRLACFFKRQFPCLFDPPSLHACCTLCVVAVLVNEGGKHRPVLLL